MNRLLDVYSVPLRVLCERFRLPEDASEQTILAEAARRQNISLCEDVAKADLLDYRAKGFLPAYAQVEYSAALLEQQQQGLASRDDG